MRDIYTYWLVRYVPDVARGEQVNVAVVVGRDGGDWAIRSASDLRRASRLGGDASVLRPWLSRLESAFSHYQRPVLNIFSSSATEDISSSWVNRLSHRFNNILQVSDAAPVDAMSAQSAVDFLFPILVANPEKISRSRTRSRLVGDMGEFYLQTAHLQPGKNLIRRPLATIGRQRGRFDFAVVNSRVGQLSQAFAFDVRDLDALEQELHSWNFIVSRLRDAGGAVGEGTTAPFAVSSEVPISVVYQAAESGRLESRRQDLLESALEAWTMLAVRPVPSEQLDLVAQEARGLVAAN